MRKHYFRYNFPKKKYKLIGLKLVYFLHLGPISINVLIENNSGRLNPIRRWDMTPATGKISEGQIDLDEDECPPAISIAGTDEDIMQASSLITRNNHAWKFVN